MLELDIKEGKLVVNDNNQLTYTDKNGNLLDAESFLKNTQVEK